MKLESQVIVYHHATVNLYLGLVHTARHMLEVNFTLRKPKRFEEADRRIFLFKKFSFQREISNWDEVVTT